MSHRRSVLTVVASLLVTTGLAGTPVASSAPTYPTIPDTKVPAITWTECFDGSLGPNVECGEVAVPTDYRRPTGATTTLGLIRLRATDPSRRLGSLFINPGGPGIPAFEFVLGAEFLPIFDPEVRARYDLIGVDPRGVGRSSPATCFANFPAERAGLAAYPAYPLNASQTRTYRGQVQALGRACSRQSPERFAHGSTANVARDMDLLRRSLGDARLNYIGYSYGTFLGATYARLFPDTVGRMVFDGTVLPETYVGRPGSRESVGTRLDQAGAAEQTYREFLRLCQAAGPGCALNSLGAPEQVVAQLFADLERSPKPIVEDGIVVRTVDRQTATNLLFQALYDPVNWAGAAAQLVDLAASETVPATASLLERIDKATDAEPALGDDYLGIGTSIVSLCADTETPSFQQYTLLAEREARRSPTFGRARAWSGAECTGLTVRDRDAYTGPWQQTTRQPVLVIGTRFDPSTAYSLTQPFASQFPNSRVLTIEGYGHTTVSKSACASAQIASYLSTGILPARGATCTQDVAPFV